MKLSTSYIKKIKYYLIKYNLPWWLRWQGKCLQCRSGFDPWVGKIPWRREWQSTPVFLPRELHGQRSLAGYSPWSLKESDTTDRLAHTRIIEVGNGNPLRCSCLENSMDRGAWWATVHGVAKSRIQLSTHTI